MNYERSEEQIEVDKIVLDRIKAGIAWLDEFVGPDWVDRVDLNTLSLHVGDRCVCGQVFAKDAEKENTKESPDGPYFDDGFDLAQEIIGPDKCVEFGFDGTSEPSLYPYRSGGTQWTELQAGWEEEISNLKRVRKHDQASS